MISPIFRVVASLSVFITLCNAFCEESYEDVLSVECTYSELTDVPVSEIPNGVQSLDLSNNKLTKLKRSDWKDYSSLENLYLTGNKISIIEPDAFSDLKNLRNLDLSNNRLRYIPPDVFSANSLLQSVNFRSNSELYLPPNSHFIVSQSLTSLDLSYCRLTSLNPQTFSKTPLLVYLDVRYNDLTNVSLRTFDCLKDLNALNLRNNKWNCDCRIVDVLNRVTERRRALGLRIELSPVKCMDNGIYRTLWTAGSLNKSCIKAYSTTTIISVEERQMTETPVAVIEKNTNIERMGEQKTSASIVKLTTDTIVGNVDFENEVSVIRHIPIVSRMEHPDSENPKTLKPETPPVVSRMKHPGSENPKTLKPETPPVLSRMEHPDSENPKSLKPEMSAISEGEIPSLWDELKSGKLGIILLLPITLGISVFVALVAVNYCTNWLKSRSEPNNVRDEYRHTNRFIDEPLIPPSISSDLDSSSRYGRSKYHVYEEIN